MTIEFTYANTRENFASLLGRVTKDLEVVGVSHVEISSGI